MPSTSDDQQPTCSDCGEAVPPDASFCPDCGADLDDASFCPDCGEPFASDDRFCSNCGAARSGDGPTATHRPSDAPGSRSASPPDESDRAFRRRVQDHLDAGWDIERDDGDRVVLVDRGIGSVGVHILLFIFTSGIGNLLYGWWHYSKLAERRRIVRGDEATARVPSRSESDQRMETLTAYIMSVGLLLIGGFICFFAVQSAANPAVLIGLAFGLLGIGTAPPVKRRLGRRHGITAFGRQKSVDHRTVRPPESVDEPCVVCGEAFDRGLVRRRRDETVVAGLPVRTHSMRYNHYCPDCARSELFGDSLDASKLSDAGSVFDEAEPTSQGEASASDGDEPASGGNESISDDETSIPDQEPSIPDEGDSTDEANTTDEERAFGRNE